MSVVDGLRELEAAATPGPWHRAVEWDEDTETHTKPSVIHPLGEVGCEDIPDTPEDAAFIAAMRNALPLLLDVVEAAKRVRVARPNIHYYNEEGLIALGALIEALEALESAQGAETLGAGNSGCTHSGTPTPDEGSARNTPAQGAEHPEPGEGA